jgi:chromate transporter
MTENGCYVIYAPSLRPTGPVSLTFVFWTFLKAGCLGFGGFMSLISMVENLIVKRRKLLTEEEMLDGISLAALMPGPQAVNVVAYAGYRLRGARGALVAGTAVVLPSFALMVLLAILYGRYGKLEMVERLFHGFVPAVAAVILGVVWRMAKQTVKGTREIVLVVLSATVLLSSSMFLAKSLQLYVTFTIVLATGFAGYFLFRAANAKTQAMGTTPARFPGARLGFALVVAVLLATLGLARVGESHNEVTTLATTFSGLSVMLFGGGYVFIPMIQHRVVDEFHWLAKQEFIDCIALSQVMPGPILVAATFIGYRVAGILGATISTIAIFSPPAFLMVRASQALDWFKTSAIAKAAMRGIRCGVIGMILVAAQVVLRAALPSGAIDVRHLWPTLVICGGALYALIRHDVDVVYVVPAGGLVGYFLYP